MTFEEFAMQHPYSWDLGDIHAHNKRVRALWYIHTGKADKFHTIIEIADDLGAREDDPVAAAAAHMLRKVMADACAEGDTKPRQEEVWNTMGLTGLKRSTLKRDLKITLLVHRLGYKDTMGLLGMSHDRLSRIYNKHKGYPVFGPGSDLTDEELAKSIRDDNATPSHVD